MALIRMARTARGLRQVLVLGALALIAGCAAVGPPATVSPPESAQQPVPVNREPPPPNVNLSGFPLPYRQGYADGCASATGPERRDAARFGTDPNYRTGWQDGVTLCRRK